MHQYWSATLGQEGNNFERIVVFCFLLVAFVSNDVILFDVIPTHMTFYLEPSDIQIASESV